MKRNLFLFPVLLLTLAVFLSSCAAIAGIFKAGVWTGIIIAGLLLAVIIFFLVRKSGDKS
jgi:hypothetical protein